MRMTSLSRTKGFFTSALAEGFSVLGRPRSIGQTLVPVLGFVAFANMGCATTIAGQYPHLDRRAVCVLPPEIEQDSTEFIYADGNVPISNFHPELVDRVAPKARTVFEYDPNADPSSVRHLPAPYNELTCPERFSILPSKDAETPPLPEASVDLLVHERRPERVPLAVAEKLASCSGQSSGPLKPIEYTVRLNVYVTDDGRAVSAYVAQSTLGDSKAEACMVDVLRTTVWPVVATALKATSNEADAATVSPSSKLFFGQPVPVESAPDSGPISHVRPKQPLVEPPASPPRLVRVPLIGIVPLPVVVGGLVFLDILLLPNETAPAWLSELNPITRQPYTSRQEYEQLQRLSPQQILQLQQARIQATQSQPPPAPTPSPQPEQQPQKQLDPKCDKNAERIDKIINAERKDPPKNGFPQGPKGIAERWRELAENKGKWGYKPDGRLGDKLQSHMDEYERGQEKLIEELKTWDRRHCDEKGYTLPRNARQFAAQKPEIGPGKPLEPAPTPTLSSAAIPAVSAPQDKKRSK